MGYTKLFRIIKFLVQKISSRLSRKLALLFSVLITLLIYTSSSLTYSNFSNALQNDFISKSKSNLKFYNISFGEYYDKVRDLSLSFRKDDQMLGLLSYDSDDLTRQRYVEARIKELYYSRNDIEQLSFYIPLKKEYYSINSKTSVSIRSASNYEANYWYKNLLMAKDFSYTEPYYPQIDKNIQMLANNKIFTFHRSIIDLKTQKIIGVISLTMNINKTKNVFYDEDTKNGEMFIVLDKKDNLYFCNDVPFYSEFIENSFLSKIKVNQTNNTEFIFIKENKKYQIIYDISDKYGWKMLKIIPLDLITSSANITRNANVLIGIIFWVISIPLIMFISKAITGSLKRLTKNMDLVGEGNFDVRLETKGNDEISYLSNKFNDMIVRINELINEEYKAKVAEKNARLKALEAQINPHFIYNSLQAISTRALQNGMFDVSEMIEALGSNLRYAIKGKEMVKVSEELIYVQNYVLLQKSRFGDRLSVDFDISQDALERILPKLFIQVLVENSVVHGIEKTMDMISVHVKVSISDNFLEIIVTDNGPGIKPDKLEIIQNELSDSSFAEDYNESMGLKNINARLKIIYEGNASLEINSVLKKGTEVVILMPK